MLSRYYFAAWNDSGCLLGCEHKHETVIAAVACCTSAAGSYVVAGENGDLRELNEKEESEFRYAVYGYDTLKGRFVGTLVGVLAFLSRVAGYHS
jgi:hypothetical protein